MAPTAPTAMSAIVSSYATKILLLMKVWPSHSTISQMALSASPKAAVITIPVVTVKFGSPGAGTIFTSARSRYVTAATTQVHRK